MVIAVVAVRKGVLLGGERLWLLWAANWACVVWGGRCGCLLKERRAVCPMRIPISALLSGTGPAEPSLGNLSAENAGCESVSDSQEGVGFERKSIRRPRWKKWEDELLVQIVEKKGPGAWRRIATEFPNRSGRQVRLRWMNHLSPEIDKRSWSRSEDEALIAYQKRYGNAWSKIAKDFQGRSDNSVKNRFNQISRTCNASKRHDEQVFFHRERPLK